MTVCHRARSIAAFGLCAALAVSSSAGWAWAGQTKNRTARKPTAKKSAKVTPGGANQVEGLNGKVGQMLFTGRWRFQVKSIERVESYTLKVPTSEQDYGKFGTAVTFDMNSHTFKAAPGYTLVAVSALLKNAQTKTQQLGCYLGDLKTAVTDNQSGSYPPFGYDMQSKGAWVTKPMLPGSSLDLTVLFAVPKDAQLKDLVFSLYNWDDMKGKDVRIAIPAQGGSSG